MILQIGYGYLFKCPIVRFVGQTPDVLLGSLGVLLLEILASFFIAIFFKKRRIHFITFKKKADINTLKTIFTGHNSFANKISMKANSISNAAAWATGTYKSNGTYSNTLSELVKGKVDEDV